MSITSVTTHLVVLSSIIISDKYLLGRRTMWRIVMVTTDRHGLRRPILVKFLLLLPSLPSTASMMNRHRHNGPSSVFVPKHFNSWNLGTGTNSLNFVTDLQDGPSQAWRTVTICITPHDVRLPLNFKGVLWTIHNYYYKISGVSLIIYLVGG